MFFSFSQVFPYLVHDLISKYSFENWDAEPQYNLAGKFTCLGCGKNESKVWKKDSGKCPKCGGEMEASVIGKIKLMCDRDLTRLYDKHLEINLTIEAIILILGIFAIRYRRR